MHPSDSVDLSAMFDELKQDLEEEVVAATRSGNPLQLGVAFREMGLLDEAIAEFQKVCTAIDRGTHFRRRSRPTPGWRSASSIKEFPNPPSTV